jgi:hypothetical protein
VTKRWQSVSCVLGVWLCLAVAIHFCHRQVASIEERSRTSGQQAVLVLPRADVLRLLSLGYDQLLADCWWLAFIQYYGDTKARDKDHYRHAYAYLDLITRLDPKFTQPYWFAAFAVGADMKRPDLAAGLIERGLNANQDNWYLPFIAGINQYLFAGNDAEAAKYYRRAARYPDAPAWLGRQADILEARVPSMIKEANTWASIYLSARDRLVKNKARQQLIEIWARIYRQAPSDKAKVRAKTELEALGFDVESGLEIGP